MQEFKSISQEIQYRLLGDLLEQCRDRLISQSECLTSICKWLGVPEVTNSQDESTDHQLIGYVIKTEVIDESGDATLSSYLVEESRNIQLHGKSAREFIMEFLNWANGDNWKEFLDKAEQGDYPNM